MKEETKILKHFKGIIDSTLREGFQFSKANFTPDEQLKIFSYLARIGVDYVEVGNPANPEIRTRIEELVRNKNGCPSRILCHIRNHERDLDQALGCGVDGVNLLCTTDQERLNAMNVTLGEYLDRLERNILKARDHCLEARVSVEDCFNQPGQLSQAVYDVAQRLGADRIGLADTLGKTLSWDVYRRVRSMRHRYSMDIEGHFHNDLGHAVSNAMAALSAGANWIDTSLMGIGERTGITPLSSFLINMYVLEPQISSKYDLSLLTTAENYISRICSIQMPINLATNRTNGFAHKAGIHLDALIQFGPHKYESIAPQLIGNRRHLVTGSLISGKTQESDAAAFKKKFG